LRRLIITADDFGASQNINQGIVQAVEGGIVNTVSAMTNFPLSHGDLKRLHSAFPDVGIGVHLNITTGKPICDSEEIPSLVGEEGCFFTIDRILPELRRISLSELNRELESQVQALEELSIPIDHLSSQHGILGLYAPFFEIVVDLAEKYHSPVRTPLLASRKFPRLFPQALTQKKARRLAVHFALKHLVDALLLLEHVSLRKSEELSRLLTARALAHPDIFIDSLYGNPTEENLRHIFENLPEGVSELAVHLGSDFREESYPSGLDTGYFDARERELALILRSGVRSLLAALDIQLIRFSDL